jgi:hypothetical protein
LSVNKNFRSTPDTHFTNVGIAFSNFKCSLFSAISADPGIPHFEKTFGSSGMSSPIEQSCQHSGLGRRGNETDESALPEAEQKVKIQRK